MAEGAGFFTRLANLWKGFVSLWISDIEKEHPEIAYENAINSMIEKYPKLKMASAQARIRIQEQLEGLSVDAEVKALDNVREHIENTIAEANLGSELKSTDLDERLKGLRAQSGDVTAKQQLAEMKAAAAAKKASLKTM